MEVSPSHGSPVWSFMHISKGEKCQKLSHTTDTQGRGSSTVLTLCVTSVTSLLGRGEL